ncbi:MAG: DNA repair protein RadC [Gammaproteobacteria bacterium]|nr:DNA repair protein RadC [Gammaproteobacteria bacterium]NNF62171.1 DNA repair protein RadC [Gammaproteobacteria bacterium]NNM20146.1 DNA repair protein RadC [Gammaproteobacteria bacterium]
MTITDWPRSERPRERLLARGSRALSDAELLAILLGSGVRGATALDLAHALLERFNTLRELLTAPRAEACSVRGLGPARWCQLQAAVEIVRRNLRETLDRPDALTSPRATRRFLHARLRDLPHEVFCCLLLDNRNRVISFEELFRGTIDGASVYPREVVKLALERNAAALILAHNHPSGVAEPSHADEIITRRLRDALALVDIRVLDHFVIGEGDCVSFAERGLI